MKNRDRRVLPGEKNPKSKEMPQGLFLQALKKGPVARNKKRLKGGARNLPHEKV